MIQQFFVQLTRISIGAMFLFSGFVKLVDPIGSQYKFQEYFGEPVLDLEFLIPYALPFSVLLIIIELMLGIFLLLGYRSRVTVWGLFGITILFLFLTWYSAYYDKVTDCGCFGDALKLSPWETFNKNVVLLVLIIFLLYHIKKVNLIFPKKITKLFSIISVASFLYITYYVLAHLPIIDFRAYAIGNNIQEGMEYKDDGEIPPVHDFMLEDAQQDLAEEILASEKVMLIVVYNLSKSDAESFSSLKKTAAKAIKKGYQVYGVSASFSDELILVQNQYDLPFDFLFCDETTLKTMIRANPGVIILNKGTIIDKKNWRDANNIKL